MRYCLVFLFTLLIGACQSLPSPNETQDADYGAYPSNYQQIAEQYLRATLRDPDTIEFDGFAEPKRRWIGDKVTGIKYGYVVCVQVNSKNLFGNMTGFRSDTVLIRDGEVIDYVEDGELLSGMKLCD
ncbi:hypothetical protein [Aestuariibacter salexigens]|uniref:hypothetical protein n=1 Tax=Aestuariibacter salexigens TaxID=226010 RepID=UPI0004153148|nr:hypothetical protein [Aestuariibacter salexigens]